MSVTLINPFEVPSGKEDECLKMWDEALKLVTEQDSRISAETAVRF